MAKKIAKFEKVSFEQFKEGYLDAIGQDSDEVIRSIYDALKLPKRATKGSAGYRIYFHLYSISTVIWNGRYKRSGTTCSDICKAGI